MKNLYSILIAILAFIVFAPLSAIADTWGDPINDTTRFVLLPGYAGTAVLDQETGLVWEQSPDTGVRNWFDAQIFCNQRNVGNRKGWRLPTVQELASLVDLSVPPPGPLLPPGHPFTNVQSNLYWSATNAFNARGAWLVDFVFGDVFNQTDKVSKLFVWCVRGGQGVDPE